MNSRTVSLVLVAVIAACPMWCGAGLCEAGPCCSQGSTEETSASSPQGTQSCCHQEESGSQHGDKQKCPRDTSPTSCQGICGGAVLEKTVELDNDSEVLILPLVDVYAPKAAQIVELRYRRSEQNCCSSGSNHGRFLRTLHSSFLC